MSEFYSKETAIKTIWKILEGLGFPKSTNHELVKVVDAVFETAPAADVRPVTAPTETRDAEMPRVVGPSAEFVPEDT